MPYNRRSSYRRYLLPLANDLVLKSILTRYSTMSLVFIKSIPRPSVLGISEWTSDKGVKLNKTKVGKTADYIRALYSARVGGLANYISYNAWVENGEPQLDPLGRPYMLQEKYERKYGLPSGYLTNKPLQIDSFLTRPVESLTYFQAQRWKLLDGTTVFDLNTMDGTMGYYVCLASSKVANSEKEWREHKFPKATHYIASEKEDETLKYEKNVKRSKAFAELHSSTLTPIDAAKLVAVIGLVPPTTTLSPQSVHNFLVAFLDTSLTNVEKFLYWVNKLKTPEGKREFEAEYLLEAALAARVIVSRQDTYTWIDRSGKQIPIGDRRSEVIEFLTNPKKNKEIDDIRAQVKERYPNTLVL